MFAKFLKSTLLAAAMALPVALPVALPMALQAEPARNFAELFHASGVDVAYGTIGDAMASGAGDLGLTIEQTAAWRKAAMAAFDGGIVIDQLVRHFQSSHDFADFAEAAAFFDSPLGRAMTLTENAAVQIEDLGRVDADGAAILNGLMADDPARMMLYRRMIEESGFLDTALASTLSINLAALNGMQASGLLPFSMSQDDMLALLAEQRATIRGELERAMYVQVAFTYADIADADMDAYVDFLTSPAGMAFYRAMDVAANDVLIGRAHAFGEMFAALLGESSL